MDPSYCVQNTYFRPRSAERRGKARRTPAHDAIVDEVRVWPADELPGVKVREEGVAVQRAHDEAEREEGLEVWVKHQLCYE